LSIKPLNPFALMVFIKELMISIFPLTFTNFEAG
jgi:hypothetical protein